MPQAVTQAVTCYKLLLCPLSHGQWSWASRVPLEDSSGNGSVVSGWLIFLFLQKIKIK